MGEWKIVGREETWRGSAGCWGMKQGHKWAPYSASAGHYVRPLVGAGGYMGPLVGFGAYIVPLVGIGGYRKPLVGTVWDHW